MKLKDYAPVALLAVPLLTGCGDNEQKAAAPAYDFSTLQRAAESFKSACHNGDKDGMRQARDERNKQADYYQGAWLCSSGKPLVVTYKGAEGMLTITEEAAVAATSQCRADARDCLADAEMQHVRGLFPQACQASDGREGPVDAVINARNTVVVEYDDIYRQNPVKWSCTNVSNLPVRKLVETGKYNKWVTAARDYAATACASPGINYAQCIDSREKEIEGLRKAFKDACEKDSDGRMEDILDARNYVTTAAGNREKYRWRCARRVFNEN